MNHTHTSPAPRRALLLVADSLGVGALPDAADYGDAGADTFGHIAEACARGAAEQGRSGPLRIPVLARLGLPQAAAAARGAPVAGFAGLPVPAACWGFAAERSPGKDTVSGHWEMAGQPVTEDWGYFTALADSMPAELLDELARLAGVSGFLGNCHASGTQVIEDFGEEHMASGKPIVYTSQDSVIQFCAHESTFGLERLYDLCLHARRLADRWRVGRVIARPFVGARPGEFQRTPNRRDFAVPPPPGTLLDAVMAAGGNVVGVGKVPDIFAGRGIGRAVKASGLAALMQASQHALLSGGDRTLVFTNLVDFDQEYGHRRDVAGYARALESFDGMLGELLGALGPGDVLVLTADHGNDPTWHGWNHTREHVPVLATGPAVAPTALGRRETFADIGQSLAVWLGVAPLAHGQAFLGAARAAA
jgi:phosphopentomutase